MGNSWDHKMRRLTQEEQERFDHNLEVFGTTCGARGCKGRIEYITSYRYVTGARGRTTRARRLVCRDHAEKFARKHGLEMPM
ncbi:MAG: hypothetical protein QHH75_11980 [Bacillota bacterium]|jgi:hypothetical protein|nr:hypothetical protein [Bacillota bacterium]